MSNNWNKFRRQYKQRHGVTSIKELSQEYQKSNVKKHLPSSRHYKLKKLRGLKRGGRGSASRLWFSEGPQKGTERHQLKKKCGSKAFLLPKEEKYPVMDALRNTNGRCVYRCNAIQSAFNRGKQQHDNIVAAKATRLGRKYCGWTK